MADTDHALEPGDAPLQLRRAAQRRDPPAGEHAGVPLGAGPRARWTHPLNSAGDPGQLTHHVRAQRMQVVHDLLQVAAGLWRRVCWSVPAAVRRWRLALWMRGLWMLQGKWCRVFGRCMRGLLLSPLLRLLQRPEVRFPVRRVRG